MRCNLWRAIWALSYLGARPDEEDLMRALVRLLRVLHILAPLNLVGLVDACLVHPQHQGLGSALEVGEDGANRISMV